MKKLLVETLLRKNTIRPPVWMMRQAGRYHWHYQKQKEKNSFIELCKIPELACEVTMGPIRDFDFDAAILFSDLLFPLEALGMGLEYNPGPSLSWYYQKTEDEKKFKITEKVDEFFSFQKKALQLIRKQLDEENYQDRALIGFVGGMFTLYVYATSGSHKGDLENAKKGLEDGRFDSFMKRLYPVLLTEMKVQAEGPMDVLSIFDTALGEIPFDAFEKRVFPWVKKLVEEFRKSYPDLPLLYYSQKTEEKHFIELQKLPIQALGVDWNHSVPLLLEKYGNRVAIQGNFDPETLRETPEEATPKINLFLEKMNRLSPELKKSWICGLGHGVLPKTPEINVKHFVKKHKSFYL